jgi:hypothetical protein
MAIPRAAPVRIPDKNIYFIFWGMKENILFTVPKTQVRSARLKPPSFRNQ